ncbi:MAG: hypothetical protein JEZ07_08610 [Phycisphaerae bacterium]|nr:hypothetical protein [Phycisphaerae bacterium]
MNSPYATIEFAATKLDPGETCYIRGGTYHEEVSLTNFEGESGDNIVFTNYNDEEVIFDGSESIADLGGTTWQQIAGTNIYKTTITKDIWQLWVN